MPRKKGTRVAARNEVEKPKQLPELNMANMAAAGLIRVERPPAPVVVISSSSESSEDVWDLTRILEESPSTYIVREYIRANVECIVDPEEEGLFVGKL